MAPQSGRLTRFRSSDRSKNSSRDSAPGGRSPKLPCHPAKKPGHSVDVPTLPELAAATGTQSQAFRLFGEILGEFDHPEAISADEVGSVVAQSDFGARLITFATLGRNSAWLRALVDLPGRCQLGTGCQMDRRATFSSRCSRLLLRSGGMTQACRKRRFGLWSCEYERGKGCGATIRRSLRMGMEQAYSARDRAHPLNSIAGVDGSHFGEVLAHARSDPRSNAPAGQRW